MTRVCVARRMQRKYGRVRVLAANNSVQTSRGVFSRAVTAPVAGGDAPGEGRSALG